MDKKKIQLLKNYLFLLLLLVVFGMGCFSLSTYQSPEVLKEGERASGVAISGGYSDVSQSAGLYSIETFTRFNISERMDGGVKLFGIPVLMGGIEGDLKYQIADPPFAVSAGFGAQLSSIVLSDGDGTLAYGFTPMLIAGSESYHFGGKVVFTSVDSEVEIFGKEINFNQALPALFIGLCIGEKPQLIPGASFYFRNKQVLVIFGLSINFKSSKESSSGGTNDFTR